MSLAAPEVRSRHGDERREPDDNRGGSAVQDRIDRVAAEPVVEHRVTQKMIRASGANGRASVRALAASSNVLLAAAPAAYGDSQAS
jgi:hypothetical protein